MNPSEDLIRRLALNDEKVLSRVLARQAPGEAESDLPAKIQVLLQLAAFLAVGASAPLLRETCIEASAHGATEEDMVGVLVIIGSAIGLANLVAAAPKLAMALGYDLDNGWGVDRHEPADAGRPRP